MFGLMCVITLALFGVLKGYDWVNRDDKEVKATTVRTRLFAAFALSLVVTLVTGLVQLF